MADRYTLSNEVSANYAGTLFLKKMVEDNVNYPVLLEGSQEILAPVFRSLMALGLIQIQRNQYTSTQTGKDVIRDIQIRYREYLDMFDQFCTVDLTAGTFAFAHLYDDEFSTDNDPEGTLWKAYLSQENWEDLRVAVAEYTKVNPIDIVFMSFLNEGRFNMTEKGWEVDLVLGDTFEEMFRVCNTNLSAEQIRKTSGDEAMPKIVKQGRALRFKLLKTEQKKQKQYEQKLAAYNAEQEASGGVVTETVTEVVTTEYVIDDPFLYYEPWYDPLYVSPLWAVPLWVALSY